MGLPPSRVGSKAIDLRKLVSMAAVCGVLEEEEEAAAMVCVLEERCVTKLGDQTAGSFFTLGYWCFSGCNALLFQHA